MTRHTLPHRHKFDLTFPPLQKTCLNEARACTCGKVRKFKQHSKYPKSRWVDGCAWPTSFCAAHPNKVYETYSEFMRRLSG